MPVGGPRRYRLAGHRPSAGQSYDDAMTSAGYLRFPHIHGDLLAFVAEDDVWLAPLDGGRAWRLSADRAEAASPRFSRDGQWVAWTSWRDGPAEVYLAGVDGERARRLTYWSDQAAKVCGWTGDGAVLALSANGQAFERQGWAYAVPVEGGAPQRLPFGPVADVALEEPARALLNGSWGRDPAFWKRYRGGTAGRLWTSAGGAPFQRILASLTGQFSSPMLVGDRLAFLSDHEGTGNVYSCRLDGSDLLRHTDHDGEYARQAGTDGTRVIYQCRSEEHTSELQSLAYLVCRLLLEKKKNNRTSHCSRITRKKLIKLLVWGALGTSICSCCERVLSHSLSFSR